MSDNKKTKTRLFVLMTLLGIMIGVWIGKLIYYGKPPSELTVPQKQSLRTALDEFYPNHFSGNNEEIIIRHFFKDRRGGFFLDVGSYHYKNGNNTYYLEKYLGWRGIAIDANEAFKSGYLKNRPMTRFFNRFVSEKSNESIDFYIVQDRRHLGMSTAVPSFVSGLKTKKIEMPTIALNDLLSSLDVKKIDFVSIDIELWEPHALAGFNIEKYKPDLVCIEAHRPVRDEILAYFSTHGYKRLDQYFLFDQKNWYFVPEDCFYKIFDVSY